MGVTGKIKGMVEELRHGLSEANELGTKNPFRRKRNAIGDSPWRPKAGGPRPTSIPSFCDSRDSMTGPVLGVSAVNSEAGPVPSAPCLAHLLEAQQSSNRLSAASQITAEMVRFPVLGTHTLRSAGRCSQPRSEPSRVSEGFGVPAAAA